MIDDQLSAAANTPVISYIFCDLLVEQAEYLSGAKSMEELFSEKQWYPSGNIKVFDDKIHDYVGVPSIKVHVYNSYGHEWVYTNKDGYFITERSSISMLNTTFHELGHAAMFYRCKKNNMKYANFHKIIKESWGEFCGWYMTPSRISGIGT